MTDAREHSLGTVSQTGPTSAAAPLQLEGVTKRFRQGASCVEALRNVSLIVQPAEFVAVMGASGSGKSTLLHVATGLTRLDDGYIRVEGQDLSAINDRQLTHFRRRRIGLVFQAFNLIPALTAEENISLPLLADGRDDWLDERMTALLDRLEIASRRRHRPDALSGGEQQRVAIARALITNPALVLADEPTGSLDSVNGQNICRLLRDLCKTERRTIVVVTHEAMVAAWEERVIVMKDGEVMTEFRPVELGNAQSLAADYQSAVFASG